MNLTLTSRLQHLLAIAWLSLGQSHRALAIWQELIHTHGNKREWISSRAHLMAQAGRTQEALADYLWLSQQADCTASDWFNLGYLLEQTKQHEHAAEAFKQSVSLDPDLDRAWFGLGLTLHHQGNLDDALRALTRNTELQPMSPHGWVQLARIHGQRQETDEVLKIIRHLKGFEPKVAAELMRETGIGLTSGRT